MKHKLLLTLSLFALLASSAQAKLSREQLQRVYQKAIAQERARWHAHAEIPWTQLVKTEERKAHPLSYMGASMYGYKTPSFSQSAVEKHAENLFTSRRSALAFVVHNNTLLRNYRVVVPQPKDLTSLQEEEVAALMTFFMQGTTYGQTQDAYLATARKYQDAVVEILWQIKDSSHLAIFLIDCRSKAVYLFIDGYKNQQ